MQQLKRHYSVEEYFAVEEMSEVRHEYFDGEISALSGASHNHNQIALNIVKELDVLRGSGCRSSHADLRLKTPAGLYTFPDVMVICGPDLLTEDPLETVTNPVMIAEVLSASKRDYDRGPKFDLYRAIPTLRDYLLVDQYAVDVEHRFLSGARWESTRHTRREDNIQFTGVAVTARVGALYDLVDFSPLTNN